jgi:digeranylgeranylglycerophospholipid reductase
VPERYDVIVVGGGPAGLAAAKTAAAEGGKVLLLELQAQIGGQTQSAVWAPSDIAAKFKDATVVKVSEVKLHSPHQYLAAEGDFGAILDRRWFDKLLAAEAVEVGVEIWVSCPVKELLQSDGVVKGVYTEAGPWAERLECEIVIDASGARGQWSSLLLRKVLGRDWSPEQLTLSNEYLMANVSPNPSLELYFTSYFAPAGHAWIYPFDKRFAMVGIRGVRIHPDAALDEFIGRRAIPRLERAVPVAAYRGQLPLESALDSTCSDGILAVGSAAGQVYAPSGEGLRYALWAGELAGKIAIDAITEGDVSKRALAEYDRRWMTEFGNELRVGKLLHGALRTSPDQKMDALFEVLAADAKLTRAFVNVFRATDFPNSLNVLLGRDEIKRVFGPAAKQVLELYKL